MKRLVFIITMALMAFSFYAISEETADHSKFEILQQDFKTAPDVTKACLTCHNLAAEQVMKTVHWTWEFVTKKKKKSGKYHVINNFCIAVKGNEPRCTSCHTGFGWRNQEFHDTAKVEYVDCLVCHEQSKKYKKFPIDAGHPPYVEKTFAKKKKFNPVDLSKAAQSVGRPKRNNCGVCHFNGGGGDGVKHGDMDQSLITPDNNLDVHMGGEDMACVDCHTTVKHNIPGSIYEYHNPEERPMCSNCHTETPHKIAKLNDHTGKVACQTCHIPAYARGGTATKMNWDWSKAGDKSRKNSKTYDVKKGEFILGTNVTPEYFWHNGDMDNTLPTDKFNPSEGPIVLNKILGSPSDTNSKIYPFKVHRGKQIFDAQYNNFIVPKLFGSKESGAYWKTFDWGKAATAGMKNIDLPYSGEYTFVETEMNWAITHMVAPKEQALSCNECHTDADEGRMAGIEGVYIPGRDHSNFVDQAGIGLLGLTFLGVFVHIFAHFFSGKKKKAKDEDENDEE